MVAIVIPYYCGSEFIDRCISSVNESFEGAHIYVVDNDPNGAELKDERVTVLTCLHGIGFGRAANVGAYQAMTDGFSQIIVSNQDVIFEAGSIRELIRHLDREKNNIILPMLTEYDSGRLEPHFVRRTLRGTGFGTNRSGDEVPELYSVEQAGAACFAIHANTVESLGLFDPVFHMYGEDDDLFARIKLHGGNLFVATKARVRHFHSLINADRSEQLKIRKQQAISIDILRARESSGRTVYLGRSLKEAVKALLKFSPQSSLSIISRALHNISNWEELHNGSPDSVKHRINEAIKSDRQV